MFNELDPQIKQAVKEVHILLMYITGWVEKSRGTPHDFDGQIFATWDGYSFEVLNILRQEGIIADLAGKKMCMTREGVRRAELIKRKYLQNG